MLKFNQINWDQFGASDHTLHITQNWTDKQTKFGIYVYICEDMNGKQTTV